MNFRQAEVEHLHGAIRAHLDVGGLEIAVDDAAAVGVLEPLRDLVRDLQRAIHFEAMILRLVEQILGNQIRQKTNPNFTELLSNLANFNCIKTTKVLDFTDVGLAWHSLYRTHPNQDS